jgi:hypothetical protein
MKYFKIFSTFLSLSMALFSIPVQATPNQSTTWGHITLYSAGWTVAAARVQLDTTFYNPEGCSYTDGYIIDPTSGGASLFASVLLTAYSMHQHVLVTVDGCYSSRPKIIGIDMMP